MLDGCGRRRASDLVSIREDHSGNDGPWAHRLMLLQIADSALQVDVSSDCNFSADLKESGGASFLVLRPFLFKDAVESAALGAIHKLPHNSPATSAWGVTQAEHARGGLSGPAPRWMDVFSLLRREAQ